MARDKAPIEEAIKTLKENHVFWVQCHFVDIPGRLRSFSMPAEDFIDGSPWESGMSFDGSSVGLRKAEDSDLLSLPDPTTLRVLPYGEGSHRKARVVVDILHPNDRKPFEMDPRYVALRADEHVKAIGADRVWVQPELEFFLLKSRETLAREVSIKEAIHLRPVSPPEVHPQRYSSDPFLLSDYTIAPKAGYFAPVPLDITDTFRNEFSYQLSLLGIPIKYHHHEGGGKQVEVEFKHIPSIRDAGDASVLYKFLSRTVAVRYGFIPTYMPKPLDHDLGNGMHIHQWLERDNAPWFHDPDDEFGLSQDGRYYIGGIMAHARTMCAVTNPTINSYKRLVPEFEAPVYVAWSARNRTALVRIPSPFSKVHTGDIEVRHPDTSANPYLAFSVVVWAGLDGIKRKMDPGDPITGDVTKLSKKRMRELNIQRLPATLVEAVELLETDDMIRQALGKELFDRFLEMTSQELLEHNAYVSPWEVSQYFDI